MKNHTLNLILPDNFESGKFEIIVLPVDEQVNKSSRKPSDFRGCISKERASELLMNIDEIRKEWERDIFYLH